MIQYLGEISACSSAICRLLHFNSTFMLPTRYIYAQLMFGYIPKLKDQVLLFNLKMKQNDVIDFYSHLPKLLSITMKKIPFLFKKHCTF